MFLVAATGAYAQTTTTIDKAVQPNLDTLFTTTVKTSVTHPYVPPVKPTPPGKLVTTSTTNLPISYSGKTNLLIKGITIDLKNGSAVALLLTNCKVVHITKCIIKNTSNDGIQLNGCSNVLIDSCLITNVKAGVNAKKSVTVQVIGNQFLNMNGPFPSGNFVQLNNVTGSGNWVNGNRCEDIAGVAKSPEDGISIYQCTGLPADSIQVIGNWIRGGQIAKTSGGAAGIVLGDVGGSYQVARNNIVVNGGYVGMQVQGGSHIKMDHNIIFSTATPYSNDGLSFGNYSGKASTDVYIGYNKIKFFNKSNAEVDAWWDPGTAYQPVGWSTNILKANIDATILPVQLITF